MSLFLSTFEHSKSQNHNYQLRKHKVFNLHTSQRRQWQPTPVLLPGKSHEWAAVHGVAKSWTRLSDFTFTSHFHALEKEMATYSSVLAWRIPGMGEPGGLPSMGSHRVGHDWSSLAAADTVVIFLFRQCLFELFNFFFSFTSMFVFAFS